MQTKHTLSTDSCVTSMGIYYDAINIRTHNYDIDEHIPLSRLIFDTQLGVYDYLIVFDTQPNFILFEKIIKPIFEDENFEICFHRNTTITSSLHSDFYHDIFYVLTDSDKHSLKLNGEPISDFAILLSISDNNGKPSAMFIDGLSSTDLFFDIIETDRLRFIKYENLKPMIGNS